MQLKIKYAITALPIALLLIASVAQTQNAFAWGEYGGGTGYGGGYYHHPDWGGGYNSGLGSVWQHITGALELTNNPGGPGYENGVGGYDNSYGGGGGGFDHGSYYNIAYQAGQQQAISDQQAGYNYSPYPTTCCHGWFYKHAFAQGYEHQWTLQEQTQTQTTKQGIDNNVNVENSPGARVNIYNSQTSNQGQDQSGGSGGP
jgi:hypothetical protein